LSAQRTEQIAAIEKRIEITKTQIERFNTAIAAHSPTPPPDTHLKIWEAVRDGIVSMAGDLTEELAQLEAEKRSLEETTVN
jgi:hypothetical protein